MNFNALSSTLFAVVLLFGNQLFSQASNSINITPKLAINAYLETYYGFDFAQPSNDERPSFLYNFTDHNQININSAIGGIDYKRNRFKGNLLFMGGTYVKQNSAHEPSIFKHIYEATLGFKILKKHDLWFEFGIMESNLGFENVRSRECLTLTRSLLAESSPYYLNAAKLGFTTSNKKWEIELLFSNGWQQMIHGYPSFGHTLIYTPNEKWKFNSSSFIGRVDLEGAVPALSRVENRFFHNFYAKYSKEKSNIIAGIDFGVDQLVKDPNDIGSWLGAIAVYQYDFNKRWNAAARVEYFLDPNNSVAITEENDGFENVGASLNIDYQPGRAFLLRLEGRLLSGADPYYSYNNQKSKKNFSIVSALIISLWK